MVKRRYPGVTPLGEGWFQIRSEVRHPKTGAHHEVNRKVKAASPAEAAILLVNARADWLSDHGAPRPVGPRKLGDALGEWLERKRDKVKPSTASTYRSAVRWWQSVLGDHYLEPRKPGASRLEADDVDAALSGAIEGGDATDTVNGRLRVLRTFAREAKCKHIVENVHAREPTVHEAEADEDEGRGLELEELRRFFSAIDGARLPGRMKMDRVWRPLLATLAWTGMRFGEASALEWRDLRLETREIAIRRAVWHGIVGHVKAKASRRTIVVPEELADRLRDYRRDRQIATGAIELEGLVFPSAESASGYVSNTGLRKNMLLVCKHARIDLDDRPALHCLRHTINNLVRQHASELVRQSIIGHADEAIGHRYSEVGVDEKREVMAKVFSLVKGG
jgi:integrase